MDGAGKETDAQMSKVRQVTTTARTRTEHCGICFEYNLPDTRLIAHLNTVSAAQRSVRLPRG
ncbi:MAG: hypothetical protein CO095_16125 [Armatimonadetes bacterium CG_4_9_14_3_um_filter_58_7]|nr:MAG: hypothetical protein CO095_16125 [Armatimonadetes bacterium CG_4_9_14_3_um_filter_58_7]